MLVAGFGNEGQSRLSAACAMIIGCGALGCASADLLARGGVGRLIIIDRDIVEFTNLQRQCLFDEADAREQTPKALAAAARLARINSEIRVTPIVTDVTHRNIEVLLDEHRPDVLLDGTDNFQTRFLLNDVAVKRGVPLVYAGVLAAGGMQMTIRPLLTPCLRCIFDAPPTAPGPTCDTAGVLGPAVAIAASYQASDAIKLLAGLADRIASGLVQFDLLSNTHRVISTADARRPDCPACALGRFEFLDGASADTAAILCGRNAVQIWSGESRAIDLAALRDRLIAHGAFILSPVLLRGTLRDAHGDGGAPIELTVFADGRTLVRGTSSIERARGLHARYVGN